MFTATYIVPKEQQYHLSANAGKAVAPRLIEKRLVFEVHGRL